MEGERASLQRISRAPDAGAVEHDGPDGAPVVPGDGQIVGGDMATKISILFYSDARDTLLKALGD